MLIWIDTDHRGRSRTTCNSINGLNHYIGMKAIEPDAIPELRLMPWIVAALDRGRSAGGGVGPARAALRLDRALRAVVALAGLVDFWSWGYDYGHDLDPTRGDQDPGHELPAAAHRLEAAAQLHGASPGPASADGRSSRP